MLGPKKSPETSLALYLVLFIGRGDITAVVGQGVRKERGNQGSDELPCHAESAEVRHVDVQVHQELDKRCSMVLLTIRTAGWHSLGAGAAHTLICWQLQHRYFSSGQSVVVIGFKHPAN